MNGRIILIDEERCNGCMLCVVGCSIVHTGEATSERSHIKVWRTKDGLNAPLTCHHCETPSCARACPTKACHEDAATQRVLIDADKCIGCRSCVIACPFGHAHYDSVARVSTKCDYCDGDPECVRACAPRAITYVWSAECSQEKQRESVSVRAALRLHFGPKTSNVEASGKESCANTAGFSKGSAEEFICVTRNKEHGGGQS